MTKLTEVVSSDKDNLRRNKHKGRRFLSSLDMSILKHDISIKNAKVKRGEIKKTAVTGIYMCGCSSPGCAIHYNKD